MHSPVPTLQREKRGQTTFVNPVDALRDGQQPLSVWLAYLYLMGLNLSNRQIAQEWHLDESDGQAMPEQLLADIDACFNVDSIETPFAGGGLNAGLRDLARFGQMLLDNGEFADMVIARFASYPIAGNAANDPTTLPAYQAVADYLMQHDKP